ncbi:hypothetical protein R3P38DRAFT_3195005 [Favolaschia claudopus]|uniref:Uncharacterized protein n=1 Tax=Favolaschia claudopus TaxID=2862362 RepID=A0AAW0BAJ4_9AGAR
MDNIPSKLLLSALRWTGEPTTWSADDGDPDEYVGTYSEAANVSLNRIGLNHELDAIEYKPANLTTFQYTRKANIGTTYSEIADYGGIYGDNMPPLLRICLPDRHPWPETFKELDWDPELRPLAGPPFKFSTCDWNGDTGIDPESLQTRALTFSPDMPGQPAIEVEPKSDLGHESGSWVGLGWHGPWVTALLEKQDRGERLGNRREIVWNSDSNKTWGAEVHLEVAKVTEVDKFIYDELDESEDPIITRGISSYTIRASILRVFVKSQWFIESLDGCT